MPDQIRQPGASDETARQETQFSPSGSSGGIDPQNNSIQGQNKDEVAHGSMEPEDSRTVTGVLGGGSGDAGGVGSPGGSDQQEGGQRWGGDAQAQQQQFGGQGSGPGEAGSVGGAPFSAEEAADRGQAQAESDNEGAVRAPEWEGQQQAQSDSLGGQMGGGSSFEQIREHMEVVGADDVHLGTVDKVEGDRIKLTKADSGMGSHQGHHHYISRGLVAAVEGDRVRLSATAANAYTFEEEE
jgi:hypothetical protein